MAKRHTENRDAPSIEPPDACLPPRDAPRQKHDWADGTFGPAGHDLAPGVQKLEPDGCREVSVMTPRSAAKWVYGFAEGGDSLRELLGGKGASVAEMTRAGMPVPPGFTITTAACQAYFASDRSFPAGLQQQVEAALANLENATGKGFGSGERPLLVSVRSGARVSMPGMMDTVLNLGLNAETLQAVVRQTGDERFGWDAYRRFVQGFGSIVMGVDSRAFEAVIERHKSALGRRDDSDMAAAEWQDVVAEFKALIEGEAGGVFPEDARTQLLQAIRAVFDSWHGKRAVDYREFHGIPHEWGTACNVQTMVFGNMGARSGTGVAFTRDPNTGERRLFGEYLLNAQGEDVVAGVRTPLPMATLEQKLPAVYRQFEGYAARLELHYKEMQDLEFTIENGRLFMLQTRAGKRSPAAAVKIAVDLVREGVIDEATALSRVEPAQVDALLHPRIDPGAALDPIATGLNASPGAATGIVAFSADAAAELGHSGEAVILVRPETSPDDFHGMAVSAAILTSRGGATSHAAIVARQLGKPAVVGCEDIRIDLAAERFVANGATVKAGEVITVDGTSGNVMAGAAPLIPGSITDELSELLRWADKARRLAVWANADTPEEAELARTSGAEGIGLCRTEHMFREGDRLPIVREMILAESESERRAALAELLPIQRADFHGILHAMRDLPVVIRLLDPPLHEFLPDPLELRDERAALSAGGNDAGRLREIERTLARIEDLHEANPMLGLRGCRLGIIYPEVYEMQVRAIIEAAAELQRNGIRARPEIMIPLVGHVNELRTVEGRLRATARQVQTESGAAVEFKFGTMIEVPRACLTAGEIAGVAEFFSFGTNDLTQTIYGISRDDAEGKFLLDYVEQAILPKNPFQELDREGVGAIMRIAVEQGRAARGNLEVGICGEHGGDPASIAFCESLGLDYVSASPYRVPVARLAAAQASLESGFWDH